MGEDGKILTTFPLSGEVARVKTSRTYVREVEGVPVHRNSFGEIEGLPPQEDGTMYIVSILVLQVLPEREDLLSPDTTPSGVVRDEEGKIRGVKGFQIL